jgi:2-methylisocitrate lyase-like PEP mutase family enzyme
LILEKAIGGMTLRLTTKLKNRLQQPSLIMAPGVVDAMNARLVAEAGFEAIYMTGAGTTAARLGMPDVGLLSVIEMADNAGRIADASGLPLISDADTGYGSPVNVFRTVSLFEKAGVAGIHIEDQNWPKRCGHLAGKTLIPADEMAAKINAACDARKDSDFTIIARTDALALHGLNAALDRAKLYEEAGADVIFVESPQTEEEISTIPKSLSVPTLFNMASSGKTPFLSRDEIQNYGYKIAIYPNFAMLAAIPAVRNYLSQLRETGTVSHIVENMASFQDLFNLLGMEDVKAMEERYSVDDKTRVGF